MAAEPLINDRSWLLSHTVRFLSHISRRGWAKIAKLESKQRLRESLRDFSKGAGTGFIRAQLIRALAVGLRRPRRRWPNKTSPRGGKAALIGGRPTSSGQSDSTTANGMYGFGKARRGRTQPERKRRRPWHGDAGHGEKANRFHVVRRPENAGCIFGMRPPPRL
jgi:hypothetical protein